MPLAGYRLPAALVVILVLAVSMVFLFTRGEETVRMTVYADRTLQPAMEELAEGFTEYMAGRGIKVNITFVYGSSGFVLSQLKLHGGGDLYVSDDKYFAELGLREGVLSGDYYTVVGTVRLALLVQEGNPKGITSLEDALERGDVVLALGNPEHVSAGVLAGRLLEELGLADRVEELVKEGRVVYVDSAAQVASRVMMGAADAGISFNVYLVLYPDKLDEVRDPAVSSVKAPVVVAVPTSHGDYSIELFNYVAKHREAFYKYGVEPAER